MAEEEKKQIVIDEDACIGCGACEGIAPEYFKVEDGVSKVQKEYSEEDAELIQQAIDGCAGKAISLK